MTAGFFYLSLTIRIDRFLGEDMIRTIEELSMNAWPAMKTLHYDGWILRYADGYTKRANSIYPLYSSEINIDEKIEFCELFYRGQDLPTVFKMTEASIPADLDAALAARGYQAVSCTSVQSLDLRGESYETSEVVDLSSTASETWHAAFARMNNVAENRRATHEGILHAILPDKCFVSINADGHIIGCGLGVLQTGYLGLFDILIDTNHRRQGHGKRLMMALLNWGQQNGSNIAYLQVMCDNEPALGLYGKFGFQEKYQYWYRIKA
jgi:ribosomal protein S18 acetylase RimI-like enzyme